MDISEFETEKQSLEAEEFMEQKDLSMWTYSEDSPLLSFRREKDTGLIYTYWGQISAILRTDNEESGRIYFEKVEED